MKTYEQLFFDLLKEYQQTPQQTAQQTSKNPKTLAIVEILKKANVTDQNILKSITDILETEEEQKNTPNNPTPPNPTTVSSVPATSNIKV
jgi:hypothetical protein